MEKITQDLNALPTTDPHTWREQVRADGEGNFDFNDSHEPWEFPLISRLGLTQRVQYWALDEDSDSVLQSYCKEWAQDILTRENELSKQGEDGENLIAAARTYQEAMDAVEERQRETREHIEASVNRRIAASGLTPEEYDAQRDELRTSDPAEWFRSMNDEGESGEKTTRDYIRAEDEAQRHLHGAPMENLLSALVRAEYEVSEAGVRLHCEKLFSKKKHIDTLDLEYYMEHDLRRPTHAYRHHVFAYPGANLPSYFYDEMVFMNYIQATVEHGYGQEEMELIESAIQRGGPSKEWFLEEVMASEESSMWRGWWT